MLFCFRRRTDRGELIKCLLGLSLQFTTEQFNKLYNFNAEDIHEVKLNNSIRRYINRYYRNLYGLEVLEIKEGDSE